MLVQCLYGVGAVRVNLLLCVDFKVHPNALKDGFIIDKSGKRKMRKTTAGPDLLSKMKNDTVT